MTTLNVRDANTGNIVAVDIDTPTGSLYVRDANTGELVLLDLSAPTGTLNVVDADTGDIVEIDYDNPVAVFNVNDPNTGEIIEIDLANPTGTLYSIDANTGDFIQVDLSTAKVINVISGNSIVTVLAGGGGGLSISGTVYDANGSTAVAGATVALGALSAVSAANGTYTIAGVAAGTSGSMTCTLAGYVWTAITVNAMTENLTGQNYTNIEYAAVLVSTYGASEVYPLVDIASGTTILAKVNAAHNGTLVGWDLQNQTGPVTDTLAPFLDGTGDYGNTYPLVTDWVGAIGSSFIFGRTSAAGDWSDGVNRHLFNYKVDNNNWIRIYKHGTLGLYYYIAIGGVIKAINLGIPADNTAWFMAAVTWQDSANGNAVKGFLNGTQVGATQTGFGAWSGTPASNLSLIGAISNVPGEPWKGWLAYHAFRFGAVWTPTNIADIYSNP